MSAQEWLAVLGSLSGIVVSVLTFLRYQVDRKLDTRDREIDAMVEVERIRAAASSAAPQTPSRPTSGGPEGGAGTGSPPPSS